MRSRGFTLIELLVVLAVAAIVAALLFPVLSAAKARASAASCSSNLKQLNSALLNYADDWHGRLPGLSAFGDVVSGRAALSHPDTASFGRGSLWSYVRTKAVMVCPADPFSRRAYRPRDTSAIGGFNYTYTLNSYMTPDVDRKLKDIRGELLSKSRNAARTILLVDENTDLSKNASTVNDAHFATGDRTGDRHPGSSMRAVTGVRTLTTWGCANVSYVDGHVGTVPGLVRWDEPEGRKLFWR